MCFYGQPALSVRLGASSKRVRLAASSKRVRLAASSKRDGNEWAWVVNAAPTATAVWAERTCDVVGVAA